MSSKRFRKLHNAQTQVSVGEDIIVDNVSSLSLQIYGTSTSFTLEFEVSLDGENFDDIMGDNKGDYSIYSASTTSKGCWEFDVSGWAYFRAKLTAIGNGNITVLANAYGWVD